MRALRHDLSTSFAPAGQNLLAGNCVVEVLLGTIASACIAQRMDALPTLKERNFHLSCSSVSSRCMLCTRDAVILWIELVYEALHEAP